MRRIFISRRQLQIVMQTGLQKSDESIAMLLHTSRLPYARSHTCYAYFYDALIVGVVRIIRKRGDRRYFVQLENHK